jgi:hypothetical protein
VFLFLALISLFIILVFLVVHIMKRSRMRETRLYMNLQR